MSLISREIIGDILLALPFHSVSFFQIHSGDDMCHGEVNFAKFTSPCDFFSLLFIVKCPFWTNVATKK